MPAYDYVQEATGLVVELMIPIAQRDDVPGHRRIPVPPRINTVGLAEDIHSQEYGVRQGMKAMEHKYGADRIARESGFSVADLKQTWAD